MLTKPLISDILSAILLSIFSYQTYFRMKALKTRLRQFDHWRRGWMSNLEPTLYRLINNNRLSQKALVEKPDVKSILIVRNNKRIGNMYFLIPFVRQMRAQYPDAKLTLMLNQPWQGEVFANMGVDEIVYSHFSFKEIVSCLKSVFTLRKNDYDLIIAPYRSTGDAVLVSVLASKNKVAEHHLGSDVAFTHTFQKDDDLHHTALTSLYLIKALGNTLILPVAHQIELSQEEITAGQDAVAGLYSGEDRVCAFFRGARGAKQLSNAEWTDILNKFEQESERPIKWVEILSPDITSPLKPDYATYSNKNMRILASFLKNTDGFICCDTGPLHLADAADVKCYGLYNKTDPRTFGVIGAQSINITDFNTPSKGHNELVEAL